MNFSMMEIVIVVVVALLVIGPSRLPDVAKSIGKGYGAFRKQFDDLKKSVDIRSFYEDTPSAGNSTQQQAPQGADAFKSRWEDEASAQSAPASAPGNTTSQDSESTRAKRADLVKEDEKNG